MNATPLAAPAASGTVTPVEPALEVTDAAEVQWSDSADVVVVGWGAAGACAAIEVSAAGASVIVLDDRVPAPRGPGRRQ